MSQSAPGMRRRVCNSHGGMQEGRELRANPGRDSKFLARGVVVGHEGKGAAGSAGE